MYLDRLQTLRMYLAAARNALQLVGLRRQVPPAVGWIMTGRCNMRCMHCTSFQDRRPLVPERAEQIAQKIAKSGTPLIMVSGGEPLLFANHLEIFKILKSRGARLSLNSNGTLLSADSSALFDGTIDYLSVSVDGPSAEIHDGIRKHPGSFDQIINLLGELMRRPRHKRPHIGVRTVVMPQNSDVFDQMVDVFSGLADEIKFQPVHGNHPFHAVSDARALFDPLDKAAERRLEATLSRLRDRGRSFNTPFMRKLGQFIFRPDSLERDATLHCLPHLLSALFVDQDGSAYICDQRLGNVLDTPVLDIWADKQRQAFLRDLAQKGSCDHPCWIHSHTATGPWAGKLIQAWLRRQ